MNISREYISGWKQANEDRKTHGRNFAEHVVLATMSQNIDITKWDDYGKGYLVAVLAWNGGDKE